MVDTFAGGSRLKGRVRKFEEKREKAPAGAGTRSGAECHSPGSVRAICRPGPAREARDKRPVISEMIRSQNLDSIKKRQRTPRRHRVISGLSTYFIIHFLLFILLFSTVNSESGDGRENTLLCRGYILKGKIFTPCWESLMDITPWWVRVTPWGGLGSASRCLAESGRGPNPGPQQVYGRPREERRISLQTLPNLSHFK